MIYRLSTVTWASEADQFNTELSAARRNRFATNLAANKFGEISYQYVAASKPYA